MKNPLKNITKNRYKITKGYRFDRWLFQIFMIGCFIFFFYVAWHYDFNLNYFYCPENPGGISGNKLMLKGFEYNSTNGQCKNPFYDENRAWESQEYLYPGEYGTKPGSLFNSVPYVVLAGFLIVFVLNHLIHNRKFKMLKKMKKGIKKIKEVDLDETDNNQKQEL